MNIATLLLTAALSLLQFVIAHPTDPNNIQRIHFAEKAFEFSLVYNSLGTDINTDTMSEPIITSSETATSTPTKTADPVVVAPAFVGSTTVKTLEDSTYEFSWQTNIETTGELRIFSSAEQIQQFNAGNYGAGILEGTTKLATSTTFVLQVGHSTYWAVIVKANNQQAVSTGRIN